MNKPTVLMILDGWGQTQSSYGNAVMSADTANFDKLKQENPYMTLKASGEDVGLPDGQMGNSEVGHLNIGAGRIVYQELTRISKAIKEGDFFENPGLLKAVDHARTQGTSLHLLGLLSDGGVHSHMDHVKGLIDLARKSGLKRVYLHAFMDGRDTSPFNGKGYIEEIEGYMKQQGVGEIATICGRYYAMDRDKRWERTRKAYEALTFGQGVRADSARAIMVQSYANDITDEFILPGVVVKNGKPVATIGSEDAVIFFNFRPDRARQLTDVYTQEDFEGFDRELFPLCYVTLTQYDLRFKNVTVAFKQQVIANTLGEYLSNLGKKQLRIAETEKYAHVTFFFNGGIEKEYPGEDRILIPSPKVATYDLKPEMSADEVADSLIKALDEKPYDLVVVNFANADMVGHTGVYEAAEKAVEAVDRNLKRVVDKILSLGGKALITADHGNAENMLVEGSGDPMTAHSINPVPLIILGEKDITLQETGRLSDLAPTLLDMMGLEVPEEMTGKKLFKREEY